MAKICRVLEKLRQLRTDQLRKSGSVCMLPSSAIKDSRAISSGPGVRLGRLKTLIFASHLKGEAAGTRISRPHKNNKTSHQFASQTALSLYNGLNWMS